MTKLTYTIIKQFFQDLGLELKRVRGEKNLTVEEAAALAGIHKPVVVSRIERGSKKLAIKAIRLINAYHQKVNVSLEETEDDSH